MKYIYSAKGSAFACIIFSIMSFFFSGIGYSSDVELILPTSTFLFAIIAGFFIARLSNRFNRIRELIASEDAYWFSLYKMSVLFGKKFQDKIRELIDQYYMIALDYEPGIYKENASFFHAVYDELNKVKNIPPKAEHIYDEMFMLLTQIENVRNQSAVISREKLTSGQWAILYILSGIIIFSLYYAGVPESYFQVITVLLSTALVLIMLIIRDLQNLRIGGTLIVTETGEEIFDYIGKLRYYHKSYIKDGSTKIPSSIKKSR